MRKNVGDTAILLDIAPYWCRVAAISVSPYYIYKYRYTLILLKNLNNF